LEYVSESFKINRSVREDSIDSVRGATFEEVAVAELPVLYRFARRLTLNPSDAEDLVGAALLYAAKAWKGFDGRHARSWLIRILRNEHIDNLRSKAGKLQTVPLEFIDVGSGNLNDEVSSTILSESILNHVDSLPEEYRLAVTLCDVEEMSYQEAAEAMDVPVGTVRSRLFRARRLLRDRVSDWGVEAR
jgi:RNA polymerase sigma-70 factor, ECF subfamily